MAETKPLHEPVVPGPTFKGSKTRHGTISGFSLHQVREEEPCDSCKRAKEVYDARWKSTPDRTKRARLLARAQVKAYQTLAQKYTDEYRAHYEHFRDELYAEHGMTLRFDRRKG